MLKVRNEYKNSNFTNFLNNQIKELVNKNIIDQNRLTSTITHILEPICNLLKTNFQFRTNLQGIPKEIVDNIKTFFDPNDNDYSNYNSSYTKKLVNFGYFCYHSFRNEIVHNKFINIFIFRLKSLLILYELILNYSIVSFISST
ncbi:MAG: hypothetical protein ACTSRP_21940 [Candidatus Helarchaeota archaeon]